MAEVIAAHGREWAEVTGVITAVDPALALPCLADGDDLAEAGLAAAPTDQRTVGDTWARQLEYASVIALVDSDDEDAQDRALIGQLHPTAPQVPAASDALVKLALMRLRRGGGGRGPAPGVRPPSPGGGGGRLSAPWCGTRTARSTPSAFSRRWRI